MHATVNEMVKIFVFLILYLCINVNLVSITFLKVRLTFLISDEKYTI
jgi:hypothetical protein